MYKTTLLSVNKRFRNLFTAFLVFFLSALVFGSSSTIEDTYNFGLFYLHTEADSQSSDDAIVYGPITAEEAGYVYEEETIVSSGTIETFPIGTLVVAMDNILQEDEGDFNEYSYGLIVRLLYEDIPVKWAISSNKLKDGIDFDEV